MRATRPCNTRAFLGLGFDHGGLKRGIVTDQDEERVVIKQVPQWFPACSQPPFGDGTFDGWIEEDKYELDMKKHVQYCDPQMLDDLLDAKVIRTAITLPIV